MPESYSADTRFVLYDHMPDRDLIKMPERTESSANIDSFVQTGIISDDIHFFLLTDYDEGISLSSSLRFRIPVIAWSHDSNREEELMGTPFLILSADALSKEYLNEVHARCFNQPLVIGETERCLIRELVMEDLAGLLSLSGDGAFFPDDMIRISDQKSLITEDPGTDSDSKNFEENPDNNSWNNSENTSDKNSGRETDAYENYLSSYIKTQYPFFGFGLYAIVEKYSGRFLGIAGFSTTDSDDTGNISYSILPAFRRQGYASEALPVILHYGEKHIGFSRIEAAIEKTNTASLALARKCGISYHII